MRELICIVCPKGCHLTVDENSFAVMGNSCPRGAEYGANELRDPRRVLTSTVATDSPLHPRLPVKTDGQIRKPLIFEAMGLLDGLVVHLPVKAGDTVLPDILGTGVNFVATRTLEK